MAIAQRLLSFAPLSELRSDRSLVRSAQLGRSDAASALIERYYPRVRAFVSYLTGSSANTDDLTQEVFTRALAALGRFNGDYRFGPWIYRIAKNLCIDEARRNNFRPEPADPADLPLLEPSPATSDFVWESVSSQLASSMVRSALARLPWRQRTALVLKELEGMSYAEICQVIGSNVRGVEATLRRARANFRLAVAHVEDAERERASCLRTLRSIADGSGNLEQARQHLRTCRECRSRASSIRSADKLLGLLPPMIVDLPAWRSELALRAAHRPAIRRSILEVLRGHPSVGLASPLAQIAQAAASLSVAASVSVASVGGALRVATVAGAPPVETGAAVSSVVPASPAPGRAPHPAGRISPAAGAETASDSQGRNQSVLTDLEGRLKSAGAGLSVEELARRAGDLANKATSQAPLRAANPLPGDSNQPQEPAGAPDAPAAAVLPAPVSLPRRRP